MLFSCKNKNYNEEEINYILNGRDDSNLNVLIYYSCIISELTKYIENGEIKKEDLIQSYEKVLEDLGEIIPSFNKLNNELSKLIDNQIEKNTIKALSIPIDVINHCCGASYIIGTYITNELLQRNREDIIPKMIYLA